MKLNLISKQSKEALKILKTWTQSRYTYNQYFDLVHLYDLEVYSNFKDETMEDIEWLQMSPPDNTVEIDFTEKGHRFFHFSNHHALWFYPDLIGEPPVIKFLSGYMPSVVAASMEEFVCRLGEDLADEESLTINTLAGVYEDDSYDDIKKNLLSDYAKFRNIVVQKIDCSKYNDHKEQMLRHSILIKPLTLTRIKTELHGDNIVKLINLPITNNNILNILVEIGYEIPLFPPKEGDYFTSENTKKGIGFVFSDTKETKKQKEENINTLYLNDIEFDYTCDFLPFGIHEEDTEKEISKKLENNYIKYKDPEFADSLWWFPKSKEKEYYIQIDFEDETFKEFISLSIKTYWSPERLELVIAT